MGILGNYSRTAYGPMVYRAGGAQAWGRGNQATSRNRWRNWCYQEGATTVKTYVARPHGYGPPDCWRLPIVAGAVLSYADVGVNAAANLARGLRIVPSATITIDAAAIVGLVAGFAAEATITVEAAAELAGTVSFAASAQVQVDAEAVMGALAGILADAQISVSAEVALMALAWLAATTEEGGMTPAGVAAAVWEAAASAHDTPGTMGEKLNAAGTAGDPWTADLSGYPEDTAGQVLRDLLADMVGATPAQVAAALIAYGAAKAGEGLTVDQCTQLEETFETVAPPVGAPRTETPTERIVGTKRWAKTGDGVTEITLTRTV